MATASVNNRRNGATFEVFNPAPSTSNVLYAYDATTDTFSIDGTLGTAGDPAVLDTFPLSSPIDVPDIVGTYSLTATVDGTGTTMGGSFSWIGESASLGIAAGSTLLAGTIESVEYFPTSIINFQIISRVDSVNAAIAALYGPVNSALIDCAACPGSADFNLNPWSVSFGPSSPVTQTPSIYGSARALPAPTTLLLLSIGLAGLAGVTRRRERASRIAS